MREHLSQEIIKMVHARKLPAAELMLVDDHLANCVECREAIGVSFAATGSADRLELAITGGTDHLTYNLLEAYVDNALSAGDVKNVDEHIAVCHYCDAQLRDLQGFAGELPRLEVPRAGWLSSLSAIFRRPVPAFAAIAAAIAVAGAIWITRPAADVATISETTSVSQPEITESINPPIGAADSAASNNEPQLPPADPPKDELAVSVKDGDEKVGLFPNGELSGYANLDARYRKLVKNALSTGKAAVPDLRELSASPGVLMGDDPAGTFRIVSPVGKVVGTDTPTFRWQSVPGAGSYVVEVFDHDFNKVASSGELKDTTWTRKLDRAKIYSWQVTAKRGEEILKAPQRPQPDARFRILDQKTANDLSTLRRNNPKSHFLLGVAYANAGLIDEAIREFEVFSRQNPGSELSRKLLRQLRSAR